MNVLSITGRLTRDPEYTAANGTRSQYARFAVAVDNEFGDGTTFFDCIVFGKQADSVEKFCHKGKLVGVYGAHEQSEYTDKNGDKRRSFSLKAKRVEFLGSKSDSKPQSDPAEDFADVQEDVPF